MRNLLFSAIEVIEVSLRTKLTHFHSERYSPLGYLDAATFNPKHDAEKFKQNIDREIENNKKVLFVKHHMDMISWMRCCTDLRNICVHYGRLYFRIFAAMPSGFDISEADKRRLWGAILSVKALYPSSEKWNNEFMPKIEALFEEYKKDINL